MHLNKILGFLEGLLLTGLLSCQHSPDPHLLVDQHCSRCHMAPDPAAIPKGIWESHVLPHMAARLGIYGEDGSGFTRNDMLGEPSEWRFTSGLFPESPAMGEKEWNTLSNWILNQALDSMEPSSFSPSQITFPSEFHSIPTASGSPATTAHQVLSNGTHVVSEATTGTISLWDGEKMTASALVGEGALSIYELTDALLFPVMGEFSPHNDPKGYVLALPTNQDVPPVRLIDSLHRPVDLTIADLNQDGFQDFVICEFGKWVGYLSIWINDGTNRSYQRKILWNEPGATQTIVTDIDQDGDPDFLLGSLLFDAPDRPDWVELWKRENAGAAWIENLKISP